MGGLWAPCCYLLGYHGDFNTIYSLVTMTTLKIEKKHVIVTK